tara:strand:+ start:1193 stop:2407 length:1215 start_codon:yes stop_codon:yes gene_type:complete
MEEDQKKKLEQELNFLKESFESEVITKVEFEKGRERIEKKLKTLDPSKTSEDKEEKPGVTEKDEVKEEKTKEKEIPKEDIVPEVVVIKKDSDLSKPDEKIEEPKKEESPTEQKDEDIKPIIIEEKKSEQDAVFDQYKEKSSKKGLLVWIVILIIIFSSSYYIVNMISSPEDPDIKDPEDIELRPPDTNPDTIPDTIPDTTTPDTIIPIQSNDYIILNSEDCTNCDTTRVQGIIKNWFPNINSKTVDYNGLQGEQLIDQLGITILPAYIFDKDISDLENFNRYSQVFRETDEYYLFSSEASGGTYFIERDIIPNKIDLFVLNGDSNSARAEKNVMAIVDGNEISFSVHEVDSDMAKELKISSVPTFIINNKVMVRGVQPPETLKEKFCELNDLEMCDKTFPKNLI